MITAVLGGLGAGKTLTLVYIAYINQDKDILANFQIALPNVIVLEDFSQLFQQWDIVLLDEIYTLADSRRASSNVNLLMATAFSQSRKLGYDLFYTAQLPSQAESRLRGLTDCIIYPRFNKRKMTLTLRIMDLYSGEVKVVKVKRKTVRKLFEIYDSYELLAPIYFSYSFERENTLDKYMRAGHD